MPGLRSLIGLLAFTLAASAQDKLSVLYSGRFFGYFRCPDIQTVDRFTCDADQKNASKTAQKYLTGIKGRKDDIRVSLGDNFAPDFLSRVIYDPATKKLQALDQYTVIRESDQTVKWVKDPTKQQQVADEVPFDNVGQFLKAAQFDAIVPGKDDFYFGPQRLSQIAKYLWSTKHGRPVRMLGANIVRITANRTANDPLPPGLIKAPFGPALLNKAVTLNMPDNVFPWVRYFTATEGKDSQPEDGCVYEATKEGDPNSIELSPCPHHLTREPVILPRALGAPALDSKRSFRYSLPQDSLKPGKNYAFCVATAPKDTHDSETEGSRKTPKTKDASQSVCSKFTVAHPLLAWDENNAPIPPYLVIKDKDTAIFGVLDADLQQQIGLLNYSWLNQNKSYDTQAKIVAPADALQQAWQACWEDDACRAARHKILLAQMPAAKVHSLLELFTSCDEEDQGCDEDQQPKPVDERIAFELVLTQVDHANATGNTDVSHIEGPNAAHRAFIVVPDSHYELPLPADQFPLKIQSAELSTDPQHNHWLHNRVDKQHIDVTLDPAVRQSLDALYTAVRERIKESPTPDPKSPSVTKRPSADNWRTFVNTGIQHACHSDLAIIQPRDVFTDGYETSIALWPHDDKPEVESALYSPASFLDEIVWKGDFYLCQPITGVSLSKALGSSDKRHGPAKLAVLGADKDEHDAYIIQGQPLDPARLYTIALTDYLAFGDTNYPDLASPDLVAPDNIHSFKKFFPISDHLLAELCKPATSLLCSAPKSPGVVKAAEYFDPVKDKPTDTTRGFTNWRQTLDWWKHWFVAYDNTPTLMNPAADGIHRSYWFVNLEKANLTYNLTTVNGPQQLVGVTRFSQITNVPQLQALESQELSAWTRVRAGREFLFFDWYNLAEVRYDATRARVTPVQITNPSNGQIIGASDPYSPSIGSNTVALEDGILSKPITQKVAVRALFSERMTTQLRRSLQSYEVTYVPGAVALPAPSNCARKVTDVLPGNETSVFCATPKSILQETRLGARLENRGNWLELGFESGHNYNSTGDFYFNKGLGVSQVFCPANGSESFSSCISTLGQGLNQLSPLYISTRTLKVSGEFVNFKVTVPVWGDKLSFTAENYFEFFAKHSADNATDTRFYEDAILKLPIKLMGNLTFSPQVELFDYQNKVAPNHFLSLTSSFSLDYSFGWHSGTKSRKVYEFPYPGGDDNTKALPLP